MEINIGKIIVDEEVNIGEIELGVVKLYPELENLEVTPSDSKQKFKSTKYGYDEVIVNAIESEELNIMPSSEKQIKEGMFNKITVAGDSNLLPENIKKGAEIFGVHGVAKTTSAKITDASYLFHEDARTDCLKEILELCDKVTSMSYMFSYCDSLTSLDLSNFNTSNVTNMSYMFFFCNNLTSLDLSNFNTSNVTNMSYMFYYCSRLIDLDLSNFNFIRVIYIASMFNSCSNLTNLKFGYNLGKGYTQKSTNYGNYILNLSACKLLTYESLMSVINNLYDLNLTYDVANGGTLYTQSLVLGATNLAKLTAEEIAIATSKGWNVT